MTPRPVSLTQATRSSNVEPAALALVIVSSLRLGQEFFSPSVELVLGVLAFVGVLALGLNPSLVLVAGGVIGALAVRRW